MIFLAEAFTRPHVMYSLAKAGFTQSYTYFTWRNTKAELQEYFEEITKPPVTDFFRPNLWPNTPDILHATLQNGGRPAFMQRLILAATLGANYGIYGPAFELGENLPAKPGSEEYLNSEKYEIRRWDRAAQSEPCSADHAAQPDPPRQSRTAKRWLAALPSRRQPAHPLLQQDRQRTISSSSRSTSIPPRNRQDGSTST